MQLRKVLITGLIVASIGTGSIALAATNQTATNPSASTDQGLTHKNAHKFAGMRGKRAHVGLLKEVASELKMDPQALLNDLKSGKSIMDVASSKHVTEAQLLNQLSAKLKTHLDKAVKSGKLSATKEAEILAKSQSKIKAMVEQKGLPKKDFKRGGHHFTPLDDVAKAIGIDHKTLIQKLKSGQSIADVAKAKGISETQLLDKLNTQMKAKLDQAVKAGKLTQDKEQKILEHKKTRIEHMINLKGLPKFNHERKGVFIHGSKDTSTNKPSHSTPVHESSPTGSSL